MSIIRKEVHELNLWEVRHRHRHGLDSHIIQSSAEPTEKELEEWAVSELGYDEADGDELAVERVTHIHEIVS